MAASLDSPDPLRMSLSKPIPITPGRSARALRTRASSTNRSIKEDVIFSPGAMTAASPAKSIVLDGPDVGGSPWRIKVTVEAQHAAGSAIYDQPMPALKLEGASTKTMKVPLKGAEETPARVTRARKRKISDADAWVPKRKATPARRSSTQMPEVPLGEATPAPKRKRGRPRKSVTAEIPSETGADLALPETKAKVTIRNRSVITGDTPQTLSRTRSSMVRSSPEVIIDRRVESSVEPLPHLDDEEQEVEQDQVEEAQTLEETSLAPIASRIQPHPAVTAARDGTASEDRSSEEPSQIQKYFGRNTSHTTPLKKPEGISMQTSKIQTPLNGVMRHFGRGQSGLNFTAFSPLPARSSPEKRRKSVAFSSPIQEEYTPRSYDDPTPDKIQPTTSRPTSEKEAADANMWRSMIARSKQLATVEQPVAASMSESDDGEADSDADDVGATPGDYTMMESEEFSMVSINTLPSARDLHSSFMSVQEQSQIDQATPRAQSEVHSRSSPRAASIVRDMQAKGTDMRYTGSEPSVSATPGPIERNVKIPVQPPKALPKQALPPSSARSVGRLPTPSSEMDAVLPSSPLASKATRSSSRPVPTRPDSRDKPFDPRLTLSSPGGSSPKLPHEYSPASHADGRSILVAPEDELPYSSPVQHLNHTRATPASVQIVEHMSFVDTFVPPSIATNPEPNIEMDLGDASHVQAEIPNEGDDIWEEEASRESLQQNRRRRGGRLGKDAVDQSSLSVNDTLPSYSRFPIVQLRRSVSPVQQTRDGHTLEMKRNIEATPVRQKRIAADVDAIFGRMFNGGMVRDESPILSQAVPPTRSPRLAISRPVVLPLPTAGVQSVEESEENDESMATTSMLDATTSDVHQIRAEMDQAKRKRTPSVTSQSSVATRRPLSRDQEAVAKTALNSLRESKRPRIDEAIADESEDQALGETEELEDDEMEGSLTHITHASSSLLSLTPQKDKSTFKPLFSSPPNPKTPHILPPPSTEDSQLDHPPSPPSILESGSPIASQEHSIISKFMTSFGFGYKPPPRPTHPVLRNLPLLPKVEPWTRTHFVILQSLYEHCLLHSEEFAPFAVDNIAYITPELARYIDIEIINWGYGVRLNERFILVARVFCDLLVLDNVAEYENLYRMKIDRGDCTDRVEGSVIGFGDVLKRLFGIRCGKMIRADEARGKRIDRRPGQMRWRLKGEKGWTWASSESAVL